MRGIHFVAVYIFFGVLLSFLEHLLRTTKVVFLKWDKRNLVSLSFTDTHTRSDPHTQTHTVLCIGKVGEEKFTLASKIFP